MHWDKLLSSGEKWIRTKVSVEPSFQPTHNHQNSHTALAIYMLIVVNFDALRQIAFLWWEMDSNQGVCETQLPAHSQPTEPLRIKPKLNSIDRLYS